MLTKNNVQIDGRNAIFVTGLGAYSLADTLECGQVFRFEKKIPSESLCSEYLVTLPGLLVDVGQATEGELYFFDLDEGSFDKVAEYFSLGYDLELIKSDVMEHTDSEWLRSAAEYSRGIAILSQDPWETLISFIISQNNNIPRIKKIIKQICIEYGVNLSLQDEKVQICPLTASNGTPCQEKCKNCGVCYTFPTPEDIVSRPEGLLPSHPGFRYSYILDAAEKVARGEVDLKAIKSFGKYEHTLEELKRIKGVGDKVASCCALFAFGNLEAFPIDVWMRRAIDTYFDGKLDPTTLGKYAGIAQQYIFHYIRNVENA